MRNLTVLPHKFSSTPETIVGGMITLRGWIAETRYGR
jgi:hypothetical protein